MITNLLGMNGFARSGKDTAAGFLSQETGFETYALAGPLKAMMNDLFGWDERHSDGDLKEVVAIYRAENWRDKLVKNCREYFGEFVSHVSDEDLCYKFYDTVIFDYLRSENEHTQVVNLNVSPRKVYQNFGTQFARSYKADMWVALAERKYKNLTSPGLIITDVRFDNEAEFILKNNGAVIKVNRADAAPVNAHASEAGIKPELVTFELDNNSTLEDLQHNCKFLINEGLRNYA